MRKIARAVAVFLIALLHAPVTYAAGLDGGVGIGGIDCDGVKRQISQNWMELRSFFRPDQKGLARPRSREFFCVSTYYANGQMPARPMAVGLTCYEVQGAKFCCDSRGESCAGL